jgi:methenyltetrahydromethanopterin cyclohydrolase
MAWMIDTGGMEAPTMRLNASAAQMCEEMMRKTDKLGIAVHDDGVSVPLIDCGINVPGSLAAGIVVSEICMAGQGKVEIVPMTDFVGAGPAISVWSDHPVAGCMAAQYAGWQVLHDDFFAMGSGPMRAAAGKEELFRKIGYTENPTMAVGVLETRKFPPPAVGENLARACDVELRKLTLLLAPTASLVGTMQVVSRSIETALHKLYELGFDLQQVTSGYGIAPLPPVAGDDLAAIGRTNDAILYGGRVTLWVTADDDELAELIPQVPSCASPEHGRPFSEIFREKNGDFYAIDPHLFSPAWIRVNNLATGRCWDAGRLEPEILRQSFSD